MTGMVGGILLKQVIGGTGLQELHGHLIEVLANPHLPHASAKL